MIITSNTGIFKTQEHIDAYVDLKGVDQLYNVEVKLTQHIKLAKCCIHYTLLTD